MRVVAVLGSPRPRSSSSALAQHFLDVAGQAGAETNSFVLNDLKYIGCQGCYGCKRRSETCVIKDDLTQVLAAVEQCDVLVMATPIYIHDVTGQIKCFIDRAFSYLTPEFHNPGARASRLAPGKKMLFLITQGQPEAVAYTGSYTGVPERYEAFFKNLGFVCQHIVAPGVALQEQLGETRPQLLEQIGKLAKQMCG